jgi:hypothetical protein
LDGGADSEQGAAAVEEPAPFGKAEHGVGQVGLLLLVELLSGDTEGASAGVLVSAPGVGERLNGRGQGSC